VTRHSPIITTPDRSLSGCRLFLKVWLP
jgi:hypothetical protein